LSKNNSHTDSETDSEKIDLKDQNNNFKSNLYGKPHKLKIRGQEIDFYIGTLATQSNISIILNQKSLSMLFTLDIAKEVEDSQSFSQFVVHFMTKSYAFGKIPNNQTRRENKHSERDILISRLIDRSIRPLINKNFHHASQLICTLLSYPVPNLISEGEEFFDVEFLAVLGSCIAVHLSSIPLTGTPIPCKMIQKSLNEIDLKANFDSETSFQESGNSEILDHEKENLEMNKKKERICFPFISEIDNGSLLDLFLSFNLNNGELIMVEAESREVSNEEIIDSIQLAREEVMKIGFFFRALSSLYKKKEIEVKNVNFDEIIEKNFGEMILSALNIAQKMPRNVEFNRIYGEICNFISQNPEFSSFEKDYLESSFMNVKRKKMYEKIKNSGKRIDGRGLDEIRQIEIAINPPFMESSHGSAIFRRGDTRALVSVILGAMYDEQIIETFDGDKKEKFILHYNFPPYATGDAYQLKTTNRREIGHGKLAFKAIRNLVPKRKSFPYTTRVCAEILSCDGSSSMATICASSIALMDAGVPVSECAAGIAIGISRDPSNDNYESENIFILKDLIGDEDHIGNMDFKIAGTKNGITALQMDVKDFGIKDSKTLALILEAGKNGYMEILEKIFNKISSHRIDMKKNAPSIIQIFIEKSFVKSIIGNRGETIKTICDVSGAKVDIDSSNQEHAIINIFGPNKKSVDKAEKIINDLILQPEVGKIYDGIIDKITDFGIFVKFLNDKIRGLIHERNCDGDRYDFYNRKKNLKIGETIKVKVLFISADGKVGLSIVEEENEMNQKNSPILEKKSLDAQKIIEDIVLSSSSKKNFSSSLDEQKIEQSSEEVDSNNGDNYKDKENLNLIIEENNSDKKDVDFDGEKVLIEEEIGAEVQEQKISKDEIKTQLFKFF
jgi:polyribonucleotide nucleotidyltransferase